MSGHFVAPYHMAPCRSAGILLLCSWPGGLPVPSLRTSPRLPLGSGWNPCPGHQGLSNSFPCPQRGGSPFALPSPPNLLRSVKPLGNEAAGRARCEGRRR